MTRNLNRSIRNALLAGVAGLFAWPAWAADVTPDRLINADKEPQNWLMNHRTYDGQRYSTLDGINRGNVRGLKLAYAVALGGGTGNEFNQATTLAEDGYLYTVDSSAVVYKIDARSGDTGRIVWRMDPKEQRQVANRGVALWGNLVISVANFPARVIATDKDSGKVVWETNAEFGHPEVSLRGAPLAVKDKILFGAAGSSLGIRDWIAALDAATGKVVWQKYTIPAPGEPGSETWKNNAWQTGGGAVWVTGTYDPQTNQTIWGTGNPVPEFDPTYRPGDNLFTNSAISWNPDTGAMNWYFQYTPGDMWDFDEVGTHILIDAAVSGEPRTLLTHSARNGFLYTMDRHNGQMIGAKPYVSDVTWTKGIDQKTGKPLDYDPSKDIQSYAGVGNLTPGGLSKKTCPSHLGANNFWPSSYSQKTKLIYIPAFTGCDTVVVSHEARTQGKQWVAGEAKATDRYEGELIASDPITGEVKKRVHQPYPNQSGTLATAGGLIFTALSDGTVVAYDDTTLDELWKANLGSGISSPPMTFAVNGRQYLAITTGLSTSARASRLANFPELKDMRNATVLYVFAL
ncbi:MAG TPA: PQQ-binding-like beta-propeller repeat protein [Xanthobacteraceae bacterium]|jgi:alcohol dehydrogenase (cytochrome c)